jgi:hypothetical protein
MTPEGKSQLRLDERRRMRIRRGAIIGVQPRSSAVIGSPKAWRPNLPDEGDNFVFEAAFAASPAMIVTHNVRDFRQPEMDWPGGLVKTPQQVLTEVSRHA